MAEERYRRDNRTRYPRNHYEGKRKDVPDRRDDVDTCPKEPPFQKPRDNIKACLSSFLKLQLVAEREWSISRVRKSSNFDRSPPLYFEFAGKTVVLPSELKVVTKNDDCCSSSTGVLFNLHELGVSGDKEEETAVVEVEDGSLLSSVEDRKKFVLMMAREEIINEDRDIASGLWKACGGKDKRKAVTRSLNCKLQEEAEIEEVLKKLQKLSKLVRTNAVDSHAGAEATDGAYLSSSSSRPCFFKLSSAGRVWNDNLLWVSGECLQRSDEEALELNNRTITNGINCKVSRKESFIDATAREDTELEAIFKELEISWFKRVASKDDKLNEMPDGPVIMATVSSTIVQDLAKRKAIKRGAASRSVTSDNVDDSSKRRKVTSPIKSQVVLEESGKIVEGADLRPHFEVEAGLLEEQCRAKAREKMVAVVDDEFKKFAHALRGVQLGFQDWSIELKKRISQLEEDKNQFEENLTWEREAFQLDLEKEREAAALKLKEVRAKSVAKAE
ncbi:hypothetical protein GIB67_028730 [Kingdonia uniflora]|uniref:Uncharacterized protein n=1 Tax=Kingdonia uniflora TaxID=39325 RepID=A0A7J7NA47_9MAGN|nr:hypothetical protein GIB67_028730 [Kingdonia uniflora]